MEDSTLPFMIGIVVGALAIFTMDWSTSEMPYWAVQDITEKSIELCNGSGGVKNIGLQFQGDIALDGENEKITDYPNVTCKNGAYHNL